MSACLSLVDALLTCFFLLRVMLLFFTMFYSQQFFHFPSLLLLQQVIIKNMHVIQRLIAFRRKFNLSEQNIVQQFVDFIYLFFFFVYFITVLIYFSLTFHRTAFLIHSAMHCNALIHSSCCVGVSCTMLKIGSCSEFPVGFYVTLMFHALFDCFAQVLGFFFEQKSQVFSVYLYIHKHTRAQSQKHSSKARKHARTKEHQLATVK